MDILYLLIPASVLLVLAILAIFAWALRGGQFEDLDREGERILDAPVDSHQADRSSAPEQLITLQRSKQPGGEHDERGSHERQ